MYKCSRGVSRQTTEVVPFRNLDDVVFMQLFGGNSSEDRRAFGDRSVPSPENFVKSGPNIMRSTRLWHHIAICIIAAGPAGGFIFGLLNPGDPDPNPVGRLVYACMMTVLTPLHAGFPPHNENGAVQSSNAWPHIVFAFSVIFTWVVCRDRKLAKKSDEPTV